MSVALHTLPNGLRIVTDPMPGLASAAVGIWVMAGGRNETSEQNGIAHFLEHMAFKGTARRSALQIAEEIEDVGGYINAYTSREATAYYARVLAQDVPLALDVIADILRGSVFDAREIEVERGVILQEIGQSLDTPDDVIFDWLQEVAYPDQALGRTILGPAERVEAFGRSDLQGFTAEYYGPENLVLSAAGAIDPEAILAEAERLFGDMPRGAARPVERARFAGGDVRRVRDLEQAHLALAFEAPNWHDPEVYAGQVWAMCMGGGMSSRLFQEIREKRGLCYTVYAQAGAFEDSGMATIYAGTGGAAVGELLTVTIDEMKRAADDMTEAEVSRAKAQLRAGLLMGLESPSARAERMARMLQIWGRVPDPAEAVARIDAVERDAVRRFAGKMATEAPAALALYGPIEGAPAFDALEARRVA